MFKFIENHPLLSLAIMAVSTIIGFVLSEIHYQQQIEREFFDLKKNTNNYGGALPNDFKFDKRV